MVDVTNIGSEEPPGVRELVEKFAELMERFDPHKDLRLVGVIVSTELGEGGIVIVGMSPIEAVMQMIAAMPELGKIAGVDINTVQTGGTPPLVI